MGSLRSRLASKPGFLVGAVAGIAGVCLLAAGEAPPQVEKSGTPSTQTESDTAEQAGARTADKSAEKPADKPTDKSAEKSSDKAAGKSGEVTGPKSASSFRESLLDLSTSYHGPHLARGAAAANSSECHPHPAR